MPDEKLVVAVDFDGTLCKNEYPKIGDPRIITFAAVQTLQENGATIILHTCRTGKLLDEAVAWCAERGLIFDYINENDPARIAQYGGDCRKISADLYIDDKAMSVEEFFKWGVDYMRRTFKK